ncbi:MAG: hypothetical protein ACI9LM_000752 [Alteromonadaceae bacterium]|jgi:hypothetical protein
MLKQKVSLLENTGRTLVLLMALIQGFYGLFAYIDPAAFALVRGTGLAIGDADWPRIYASRTLFIALTMGYLLYLRSYKILMALALFGIIMPMTDALLAFQAQAPLKVTMKHIATVIYLMVTFLVLQGVIKKEQSATK